MAASSSTITKISHSTVPVFKGEGYNHWSVRMKTFFRSQNLYKVIKEGVMNEDK